MWRRMFWYQCASGSQRRHVSWFVGLYCAWTPHSSLRFITSSSQTEWSVFSRSSKRMWACKGVEIMLNEGSGIYTAKPRYNQKAPSATFWDACSWMSRPLKRQKQNISVDWKQQCVTEATSKCKEKNIRCIKLTKLQRSHAATEKAPRW